jgi:hypothetical protein
MARCRLLLASAWIYLRCHLCERVDQNPNVQPSSAGAICKTCSPHHKWTCEQRPDLRRVRFLGLVMGMTHDHAQMPPRAKLEVIRFPNLAVGISFNARKRARFSSAANRGARSFGVSWCTYNSTTVRMRSLFCEGACQVVQISRFCFLISDVCFFYN